MKTRLFSCAKSLPLSSLVKEESTLSPFRLFSNETLQELPAPASGGPIFLSDENEIEKLLVFLVANLCFTTSELLLEAMKNMKITIEKKTLQTTLRKLHGKEFLKAIRFFNCNDGRSANKVYFCGWRGYGLLNEKNKPAASLGYCKRLIETNDVPAIKRILSAQQFALKVKRADPETLSVAQCVFASDRNGNALPNAIFRANAMVMDGEITLIDSLRQNAGWKRELRSKLHRVKKAINHPKLNIEGFRRENVSLVLVCENAVHMQKAMDFVQRNIYSIGIPIIKFTTDPLVYSSHEYLYAVKPSLFSTLFSA